QTVLVWAPLGFLWLCAPWHIAVLCRNATPTKHLSKLYLGKQVNKAPVQDMPRWATFGTLCYFLFVTSTFLVEKTYNQSLEAELPCLLARLDRSIWHFSICTLPLSLQGEISDLPRFCLFYISFGLELIALILSAFADVPREAEDLVKKVPTYVLNSCQILLSIVFHCSPKLTNQVDILEKSISTTYMNNTELKAARTRLQTKMRKRGEEKASKGQGEGLQIGHQNSLGKGVSQDVLMMVRKEKKKKKKEEKEDYPESWLIPTIATTFKGVLWESAFFKLVTDLLSFASPQILKLMISFTTDKSIYTWTGYMYAVLLILVAVFQSLFLQQYFQRCFVLGMKVRTAIMAAVYKKALVVSNDARKESTVGETVNLMSADAQRFNDVVNFIHLLWSCPLQIALAIAFLWIELGPAVLAGLAVMVLMVPINGLLANMSKNVQIENMRYKDKRMKIVNEMLNGIKILKLYAWEPSFQNQVMGIREQELVVMRKFAYLSSVSTFIFSCAPALVSLATFAVFVAVDSENVLDAGKAFTSISLFNILRFPLAFLPMLIAAMVQVGHVSKTRLEKFLGGEDLDTNIVRHDPSFSRSRVKCHTLCYTVSLEIKPGKLVAVVGVVGSGKSSLISAMLGEMHSAKGFINVQGSVAFVPQQAWIQNATLRDNILFGCPLEDSRFQATLEACALGPDLELLPGGDQTEIGEKGINLSGGQKQRVSLARAAYSQADVYLLDDPLSAVDSHVGKHLFEEVVGPKGILKDKTRILVTHGVSFLPYVDEIVVLKEGCVSEVGSYQSLKDSKGAFSEFLDTYAKEEDPTSDGEEVGLVPDLQDPQADIPPEDIVSMTLKRESSIRRSQRNRRYERERAKEKEGERIPEWLKGGQKSSTSQPFLINGLWRGEGRFSVYLQYLRAMGWGYSTMFFLVYFIQNVAFIGQNLWLSDWTNDAEDYYNKTYPNWKRDTRIGVFGALGVAQGLFVFMGTLLLANGSINASRILHSRLLNNILRVPMMFFDTTPSGRVVNRFAKDIFTVDEAIPQSFRSWIMCFLGVLGTLFVICLATPIFTAIIIPLAVVYYFVQRFYVASSRQLRRLDSVSRSPIYSHFGETVSGLSVIRAYGHQDRFLKHNEKVIDENLKSVYPWIVSNRWLAIRLEFLGNLVVFFSALLAVIARDSLDSGLVGLSISYALNVTQTLNWLVRMTSELETNIVAVERVSEYTEMENEADWVSEIRPPEKWPEAGRLRFENFKVRYRPELDLVLHGITCDIDSTEKIGIVGRTGAGKSSLTNCLFRIIEAAEGRILIDGTDIATLGLHDLRSRLTIIPQDPVLFSGTLRMNLDPFETFSDEEIWRILELSHLKEYVGGLQEGLTHEVSEGGENLSIGQRQLLCLARALLRKSRILILDEATAAVDLETDNLIQKTIRREFSHCTVLTIAHRLHSILDSSRVMVLDAGKIVEFDSPSTLFNKQGHFYSMARDAGITTVDSTALDSTALDSTAL
uniref:ATP binding cassette subfamily C member 2 n=1 Tax=Salmo trutta TaxID=8032 RepID=A0A674BQ19_SALTR